MDELNLLLHQSNRRFQKEKKFRATGNENQIVGILQLPQELNQVTTDTKAKHPNPPADATSLLFVRRVHRGSRLPAALFFKKKKINSLNKVSTINVNEAQLRA